MNEKSPLKIVGANNSVYTYFMCMCYIDEGVLSRIYMCQRRRKYVSRVLA